MWISQQQEAMSDTRTTTLIRAASMIFLQRTKVGDGMKYKKDCSATVIEYYLRFSVCPGAFFHFGKGVNRTSSILSPNFDDLSLPGGQAVSLLRRWYFQMLTEVQAHGKSAVAKTMKSLMSKYDAEIDALQEKRDAIAVDIGETRVKQVDQEITASAIATSAATGTNPSKSDAQQAAENEKKRQEIRDRLIAAENTVRLNRMAQCLTFMEKEVDYSYGKLDYFLRLCDPGGE
jgi:hypothetical protein